MSLRAWIPLIFLAGSIIVSWWLTRSQPRTFSIVAGQVSLPELPDSFVFDNADRIRALRGKLARNATLEPCAIARAESNADTPSANSTSAACALSVDRPWNSFELRAPHGTAPFRQVSISGKRDGCTATLRADAADVGQVAFAWFPTGATCSPVVGIQIEEGTPVRARGVSEGGKLADQLGGGSLAKLQLSVPRDEHLGFELDLSGDDEALELWNAKRRLGSLVLVPVASFTIAHAVGLDTVSRSCEAAPGGRISIGGGGAPITLRRVALVRAGLDVSFSLEGDWKIDTGACELSNRRLEWIAFAVLLAALLSGLGFFAWFTERRWF